MPAWGKRRWWALLVTVLLLVPVVAAATYAPQGTDESLSFGDRVSASLLAAISQGLSDATTIGDSVSARLAAIDQQPVREVATLGDSVVARLALNSQLPLGETVGIGDKVAAALEAAVPSSWQEPVGIADQVAARLAAVVPEQFAESVGVADQVVARLAASLQLPFRESVGIADKVAANLEAAVALPIAETVGLGDQVVARLAARLALPLREPVGIADQVAAKLYAAIAVPITETTGIADRVVADLMAALPASFGESVSIGDQVVARLAANLPLSLREAVGVADQVSARLAAVVQQPVKETANIADQVGTNLIAAFRVTQNEVVGVADRASTTLLAAVSEPLAESAHVADQVSTTLRAAFHPLVVEALTFSDRVSTVKVSVAGVPNSQITTDSSGNTLIAGTDGNGNLLTQVSLPPGTAMGSSVTVNYVTRGNNSITQVSGFTVPYPPGKAVTMLNSHGATGVCIVDSPTVVNLQSGVCGATDLSSSHVMLACDGAAHTFGPFPSGPSSRTYTCTPTTIGGLHYLQVSGLAYSTTIIDATPPTLALPSDVTAVLTSRAGARVSFTVSASDVLDPGPAVSCSANSGAVFPIGTTTVTCTATDAAGNTASGSFRVSVIYKFGGFSPPLQAGGTYHVGSTIPVKFTLTDAAGRAVSFATARITAGPVTGTFRSEFNHYSFDLDTRGMPAGPLTITASLDDGTTYSITINLTTSFITNLSLYCYPSTLFVGASAQCEATVASQGGPTPTGAIAFASSDGHGAFGQVSCDTGRQYGQGGSGQEGDGGGALSCSVSYSSSSPGVQRITATYPGDSHDLPSSATYVLTVALIPSNTYLTCSPSAVQPGKATHCVAVVESRDGSPPTGSVTFTSSDTHGAFAKVACSTADGGRGGDSQNGGGTLTCRVDYTPSSSGTQTITAVYPGDASHSSSAAAFLLNRGRGDVAGSSDAFSALALVAIGMTASHPYLGVLQSAPTKMSKRLRGE